jgi:hypothetical protein
MEERQIRRLVTWNRFWLALFLCSLLCYALVFSRFGLTGSLYGVRSFWTGNDLVITSIKSGYVITHLRAYPPPTGTPIVARLPVPVCPVDSEGARFTPEDLRKLEWVGERSETRSAPSPGTRILAVYYRAQYSDWE